MLVFNDVIKAIDFINFTSSGEGSELTTGANLYRQGVHRSMIISTDSGKYLVKLSKDEHRSSWRSAPYGRCYVREVGAYIVSDAMKMGLVPETKLINYDGNIGSAQKWIEATPFETLDDFPDRDIWMSGIFDILIANLDRHRGNILRENDGSGGFHVCLIDNGYSQPFTITDKSKNIIISRFAYEIWDKPIPSWLLQMLEVTPWDKVKRELYDERLFGKNAAAVDLFFQRLNFILKTKKASIPDFVVTRRLLQGVSKE